MSIYEYPIIKETGFNATRKDTDFPYLEVNVVFVLVVFLFERYLQLRQHRTFSITSLPASLLEIVKSLNKVELLTEVQSKFDKAQVYGKDKSSFGFFSSTFEQVLSIVLLFIGGTPYAWNKAGEITMYALGYDSELIQSGVLLILLNIFETFTSLPFNLYRTFVIEERHGFNKQTIGLFFKDMLISFALMVFIFVPIICLLIQVIKYGGEYFYIYAWCTAMAIVTIMMFVYPTLIAPLFNKYTPLEEGSLKTKIEALAESLKYPLTRLYVVDGSSRSAHSNAYLYGFCNNKRIVLYDTLIQQLNEEEIVSVLAHELGHWKMYHTMQGFIITGIQMFVIFALLGQFLNNDTLYLSFGFSSKPTIIGVTLFLTCVWSPVSQVIGFLMNMYSRKNEFEADYFAAQLKYGDLLKQSLVKMQIENLSSFSPDKWYAIYHYSHPPLIERLEAINVAMEKLK